MASGAGVLFRDRRRGTMTMEQKLDYKIVHPPQELADYVAYFWYVDNPSDNEKKTIGLPDGLIDVLLYQSANDGFRIMQMGGVTQYEHATIPPHCRMFCVSFKLPAVEYILREAVSDILDSAKLLPDDFWGFSEEDLRDFGLFVQKATQKVLSLLPREIDERKRRLFQLVYTTRGAVTVKELSQQVFWSSRQINRYFNQQFGISLKAYCNILRFRASLEHIAEGKLYPEEAFFDQNHFIKEVKKYAGVVPKELAKNEDGRFILLSAIRRK